MSISAINMKNCSYRIEVDPPTAARIPPINNTAPIIGPSEVCGTSVRMTTPKSMDITGYKWSVAPQLRIDTVLTQKTIYDPNINWVNISLAPGITSGSYQVCMIPFNPCHEGNQICKTISFNQNTVTTNLGTVERCAGESYSVCGQTYTQSGNYSKTCQTISGCDSTVNFTLQITPSISTNLGTIQICPGQTYSVCGQTYTQSGNYSETCQSVSGCDSTVSFILQIAPSITTNLGTVQICPGQTYSVCGQTYTQSGNYSKTCQSVSGCDSTVSFILQIAPSITTNLGTVQICPGQIYSVCGQTYSQSGNYSKTCQTISGCDSTVNFTLQVTPSITTNLGNIQICPGQTYSVCGENYTQVGIYSKTCAAANGCDSIIQFTLTVSQPQVDLGSITLCPNDSIQICGQTFTSLGQQTLICPASQGCDTLITVNIVPFVYPPTIPITTINLCGTNDTIDVCGNLHQSVGLYFDTCTAIYNGCSYQYVKQTIIIDAPLIVAIGSMQQPSSVNATDGSIEVNVSGGIGSPVSVLWYNAQGQNVSDQITAVNLPEGSYYAIVQSAGCTVQTDTVVLMHSSSTQETSVKNQIYLDPNPATETIQIHSNNLNHADRIEFYTTDGRLCYTQRDYSFGQSINIEQLPGGMLYLKVFVTNQSVDVLQLIHSK
jgi:hypothetical protein